MSDGDIDRMQSDESVSEAAATVQSLDIDGDLDIYDDHGRIHVDGYDEKGMRDDDYDEFIDDKEVGDGDNDWLRDDEEYAADTDETETYNVDFVIAKRWDPEQSDILYECVDRMTETTFWLTRDQIGNDVLIQRYYEHEWMEGIFRRFKARKPQRKNLKTLPLTKKQIKALKEVVKFKTVVLKNVRSHER